MSFAQTGWLQVGWAAYEAANGETHPAIGNVDDDPAAELVIGLGRIRAPAAGSRSATTPITVRRARLEHVGWEVFERAGGATFPWSDAFADSAWRIKDPVPRL